MTWRMKERGGYNDDVCHLSATYILSTPSRRLIADIANPLTTVRLMAAVTPVEKEVFWNAQALGVDTYDVVNDSFMLESFATHHHANTCRLALLFARQLSKWTYRACDCLESNSIANVGHKSMSSACCSCVTVRPIFNEADGMLDVRIFWPACEVFIPSLSSLTCG